MSLTLKCAFQQGFYFAFKSNGSNLNLDKRRFTASGKKSAWNNCEKSLPISPKPLFSQIFN